MIILFKMVWNSASVFLVYRKGRLRGFEGWIVSFAKENKNLES